MSFRSLKIAACTALTATFGLIAPTTPSHAGNDPFIGEIVMFAGNFCPRGWVSAQGQILPIASNSALFSILGTMFGGDGRSTFALPDMRGRVAVQVGKGSGLRDYKVGQRHGSETTPVTMPAHTHDTIVQPMAMDKQASRQNPSGVFLGNPLNENIYSAEVAGSAVEMSPDSLVVSESSRGTTIATVPNIQPVIGIMHCIATMGTFPSRN